MAKQNTKLAEVFHFDLQGKRDEKYEFLNQNSIASIPWNKLEPNEPNFFLVEKNFDGIVDYEKGFKIDEIFNINNVGIATGKDEELISYNKQILEQKYSIKADKYSYRPFDNRFTIFDRKILQRARFDVMKHLLFPNIALQITSKNRQISLGYIFISKNISDRHLLDSAADSMSVFPLYLYPEASPQQTIGQITSPNPSKGGELERIPNLNPEIVKQIAEKLGLIYNPNPKNPFETGKDIILNAIKNNPNAFAPKGSHSLLNPIDILDYIYAVLHSPTYREKYKEFLKIDFPRVPYPKAPSPLERAGGEVFWHLVKLGGEIRQIHLLESPTVEKYITQYPIDGDNVVIKPRFINSPPLEGLGEVGKVYINDTQFFDNVPETAWNFYIGGYQPAQKWLKDRKERKLEFEDILHYQKIIVALTETDRLMKEIDKIEIE